MRDLGQLVQVDAQVVGPGTGLGAHVLDDLDVLDAGRRCVPGRPAPRAHREHLDDDRPVLRLRAGRDALAARRWWPTIPTSPTRPRPGSRSSSACSFSRSLPATVNACGLSVRSHTPAVSARSQFWQWPPGGTTLCAGIANRERSYSRSTTTATHQPVMSSRRSSNRPPGIEVRPARARLGMRRSPRPPRRGDARAPPRTALPQRARSRSRAVARSPRPAQLAGDRRDADVGQAAGVDELEVGQVGGHVERDAVIRHAPSRPAGRAHPACVVVHRGPAGRPSSRDSRRAARRERRSSRATSVMASSRARTNGRSSRPASASLTMGYATSWPGP